MSPTLEPAALGESPSGQAPGVPYSARYDDVYHPAAGAWAQARHVFLGGNALPHRWRGTSRFVILETGFGLGNNFLATWAHWLDDPHRCDQLVFISIEKHPLTRADLSAVHQNTPDGPRRAELGQQLATSWPVLTPGWHTVEFPASAGQKVSLMLGWGDIATLLPELMASVDAFYLDGFAPAKNPDMWAPERLARLNRLALPGATAATWSSARAVRDGLTRAGFTVERVAGFGGKRDMVQARYTPAYTPAPPAGGLWPAPPKDQRQVLVIGGGLAGCASAWALSHQGWQVRVLDRHAQPAAETSGNPGGLFHSIVHHDDGVHARAHRAAALATWNVVRQAIDAGVPGNARGLVRLEHRLNEAEALALLERQSLPHDHVEWLPQSAAQAATGLPVPSGGWLFHQAGWVSPAGLSRWFLDEATQHPAPGAHLEWRGDCTVQRIQRLPSGRWQALDTSGQVLGEAPHLVLTCAHDTLRLLEGLPPEQACAPLPLSRVRGQVTWGPAAPGAPHPALAVAGAGYALSLDTGTVLCGSTSHHDDEDPSVRERDHAHNLEQLARLGGALTTSEHSSPALQGRVGWRATSPDRLPLVGALAWSDARIRQGTRPPRMEQVRLLPRERDAAGGLYVMTGLGSRGITWSVLAARLLAHWVCGAPCPVEVSLRDALDPARFLARQQRQRPATDATD